NNRLEQLSEEEREQLDRLNEAETRVSHEEDAFKARTEEIERLKQKEQSLIADTDNARATEQSLLKRIVEVEARFVEAAKTRQLAEAQAKVQFEKEERLKAEVEVLRR